MLLPRHSQVGTIRKVHGTETAIGRKNPRKKKTLPKVTDSRSDFFASKTCDCGGVVLNYRETAVNTKPSGKPALVIYLHGASGRGDDNTAQMRNHGIYYIYDYLKASNIDAYFAVPQCPEEYTWAGGRSGAAYVVNVKILIDRYIEEDKIDPSRIYLFAVSLGGGGAWRLLSDYTDLFAGALIASARWRDVSVENIAKTPLYFTRGSLEGDERIVESEEMLKQLSRYGGDVRFDVLKNLEHGEACVQAFTSERISWVLSHTKKIPLRD